MSNNVNVPLTGNVLADLTLLAGEYATHIATIFGDVNTLSAYKGASKVAESLKRVIDNDKERMEVASKIYKWASEFTRTIQSGGLLALNFEALKLLVGGDDAQLLMTRFETFNAIAALPTVNEVIAVFTDLGSETPINTAIAVYTHATAKFRTPQPEARVGGVTIGAGAQISQGGDIVGRDKVEFKK